VLRDEGRMPAHRRLLAVMRRSRGRQAPIDEVASMAEDGFQAPVGQVAPLAVSKAEARAEPRACQAVEQKLEIIHPASLRPLSSRSPRHPGQW